MIKKMIMVVGAIVIVAVGVVAYSFFKTPETASGPIEAIPLDAVNAVESLAASAGSTTEVTAAVLAMEGDSGAEAQEELIAAPEPPADSAGETGPAEEPEVEAATDVAADVEAVAEAGTARPGEANQVREEMTSTPIIFEIVQAESEARFLIDEVLQGDPTTVVGATDQAAGQFAVNPNDLASIQVGIIQINTRTLVTNNQYRNRAIKNRILLTDNYEFVTFTPSEIIGLPERGAVDEPLTFQLVGELQVTDVTRPVTFEVTAVATSDTRIEGTAKTTILYPDFELFIPDSPSVDTVDDEVRLELDFVADAV